MRWIAAIHITALAVATAGALTGVPAPQLPGFHAIHQSDLRRDLTYISSDELGGRMSLQPGDELATNWIAGQFAKAGLQPPVKGDTGKLGYLQPFTLIEYRPDRNASSVTLTRARQNNGLACSGGSRELTSMRSILPRLSCLRASASPPPSLATMTTPPSMPAERSYLSLIMSRKRMIPARFSTEPGTRATPPVE